jgi:outer membrane protein assembly factor BamE
MYKRMISIFIALLLTSCSFFHVRKPTIEQGNIITDQAVNQLHAGLTSTEVISIMGTPVLTNMLTPNRMEYIYTHQVGSSPRTEKRVVIHLEQDRVTSIER